MDDLIDLIDFKKLTGTDVTAAAFAVIALLYVTLKVARDIWSLCGKASQWLRSFSPSEKTQARVVELEAANAKLLEDFQAVKEKELAALEQLTESQAELNRQLLKQQALHENLTKTKSLITL